MFYTSWAVQLIFYSRVAHPGLKLSRDVKGGMKCFCKSISGKRERKKKKVCSSTCHGTYKWITRRRPRYPEPFFSTVNLHRHRMSTGCHLFRVQHGFQYCLPYYLYRQSVRSRQIKWKTRGTTQSAATSNRKQQPAMSILPRDQPSGQYRWLLIKWMVAKHRTHGISILWGTETLLHLQRCLPTSISLLCSTVPLYN